MGPIYLHVYVDAVQTSRAWGVQGRRVRTLRTSRRSESYFIFVLVYSLLHLALYSIRFRLRNLLHSYQILFCAKQFEIWKDSYGICFWKLLLKYDFSDKWRSLSRYSSLVD
jgi:hypothetical protein